MSLFALEWNAPAPATVRAGAVTVGNFDGLHRGHAALLGTLTAVRPAVLVTFDPPPLRLLAPDLEAPLLTTLAERAELLPALGVDHLIVLRTTPELLALTAEEFFARVLVEQLAARVVVEGFNFRFGNGRRGDVAFLAELCRNAGVAFHEVQPLEVAGQLISSSRIRAALANGDITEANAALGRFYALSGSVGEGAQRGRTLGFPTANLVGIETLIPRDGVYAGRVRLPDATEWYAAAVNIGANLTFGEQARKVEVHLLDFAGDLYGQRLRLEFVARLRDTQRFAGPAELVAQLQHDIEATRLALELGS